MECDGLPSSAIELSAMDLSAMESYLNGPTGERGRYVEAAEDLATALAMAPEAEKAEIKRQQSILKQDLAAAKAEAAIEGKGSASKGEDAKLAAAEHQALRSRVRELLDQIHTNADSSTSTL